MACPELLPEKHALTSRTEVRALQLARERPDQGRSSRRCMEPHGARANRRVSRSARADSELWRRGESGGPTRGTSRVEARPDDQVQPGLASAPGAPSRAERGEAGLHGGSASRRAEVLLGA